MLGIRYIKTPPTTYILQYKAGKVVREGAGLAFLYYAPTSSLVAVPIGSTDIPFIFSELTADYQEVTIQGQATYRIADAKKIAGLLNFTLDARGARYVSDDSAKLSQRIVNVVQVLTQKELKTLALRDAVKSSEHIVNNISTGLAESSEIASLGIEILGVAILAIKPTPETARALEADAREEILRQSDEAIYARRNSAVELERKIKENELNTEIAVENKKRQVQEAQMEAKRAVQDKMHELQKSEMAAKIFLEDDNKKLVALSTENAKAHADARAYALKVVMKAIETVDPKTIQALASVNMNPDQLIALAFQGLAERADKIGELNISPELLGKLIRHPQESRPAPRAAAH